MTLALRIRGGVNVKLCPCYAVLACLCLTVSAQAQPGPDRMPEKALTYTRDYERYVCAMEASRRKFLRDGNSGVHFRRQQAITKSHEGRIDNPYPPELHDHAPGAYRLAERILLPLPCEAKPVALPKGFRCRLDRLVLRAQRGGRSFAVEAASVDFGFKYILDNRDVVTEEPLRLRHGNPRPYGSIVLKGRYDGREFHLSRSWALGFPRYSISSETQAKNFEPDGAETLPFVTGANSRLYVFDFAADEVQVSEPLRGLTFVPARCRS
jgi:hypothetical protein